MTSGPASDPKDDPLDLVGTTILEKYAVEGVVGKGGFAIVYRAPALSTSSGRGPSR
jgi:hypothetical protein